MGQAKQSRAMIQIDPLALGIALLTLATALIHLSLAIALGPPGWKPFPLLFYLNALGYLVLLIALYLPQLQRIQRPIRWLLIFYAALTFALWFVVAPHRNLEGVVDKAIEVALLLLLIMDDWRTASQSRRV